MGVVASWDSRSAGHFFRPAVVLYIFATNAYPIHSYNFLLCLFVLFYSWCSHAQVFGKTLEHEFHISYIHAERYLLYSLCKSNENLIRSALKLILQNLCNLSVSTGEGGWFFIVRLFKSILSFVNWISLYFFNLLYKILPYLVHYHCILIR